MGDNIRVSPAGSTSEVPVRTEEIDGVHWPLYGAGHTIDSMGTTTPLNNGQTYTSDWVQVDQYESIVVAVSTDQDGEYTVQYSPDGVNQDSTLTRYYRTANINAPHRFTNTRKYARVTFTNNSGSNQTYLRLQVQLGNRHPLNIPLDGTVAQDYDATCTRPTDWHAEVALGRRQGDTLWNKFGYNQDVDIGTEVIASFGGTYSIHDTGETLSIVSTSSADDGDPAGTGCNSIVIYGVDENWDEQTEVVTLNGISAVTTTTQWIGINRVAMFLCGTGQVNAGTITITGGTTGDTLAQMPAGEGVTQQLIFYVPQKTTFLAEWLWINTLKQTGGNNPIVTLDAWVYSEVNNGKQLVASITVDTTVENVGEFSPPEPFPLGEKSIFWLEATTDKADTVINGRFTGILSKAPSA